MSDIVWHEHAISKTDRASMNQQKPVLLWFTGLSGSGKSTIAGALEHALFQRGQRTYLLDGDNVRHGLNHDLGFSNEDRVENIRRIGEVAKLMVDAGLIVLAAFVSPFRADRALVRGLLAEGEFIEIHVDTPLAVCESRDPKGLYKKARAGEIKHFTGIDSAYEPPQEPEILLNTGDNTIDECVAQILAYLNTHGYFIH